MENYEGLWRITKSVESDRERTPRQTAKPVEQEQDPHILAEPLPVDLMASPNADGLAWHACKVPFMVVTSKQGAPQAKGTCCCRWHNHILLETQVQKNSPNPRGCDPETNPQVRKIHSNEKTSPPHSDSMQYLHKICEPANPVFPHREKFQ